MPRSSLLRAARALRARVVYRIDTLLSLPPIGQLVAVVLATGVLVVVWAIALRIVAPSAPESATGLQAVWWSVTHFMDGGTMASDPVGRRIVSLGATASGVLVLSLLTAAFASKMNERIQVMRSGLSSVVERDHILVLGFTSDVVLMAGEIARSAQWRTVVVLTQFDKVHVETALRRVTHRTGAHVRVVVRTGDPRFESALLRVSAQHARSIVVVPPPELGDAESVQWTLSTLLAVRRVVEDEFTGKIIVKARHEESRDVLLLASEPGVAGPRALATEIIASDDIIARVLAQSARQEGVYFALRQLLTFNRCEIYVDPLPEGLVGLSFDEAHARVSGAVLLGIQRPGEEALLAPSREAQRPLREGDRIIVLAVESRMYGLDGALPAAPETTHAPAVLHRPENVVVLGFSRTLPLLVRELDELLPAGSTVRVAHGASVAAREAVLDDPAGTLRRVSIVRDVRTPRELIRDDGNEVYTADAVIILGCEQGQSDNGDADALANLLWLRHGMRRTGRAVRRTVTEVRDPRSALHVPEMAHDLLVSSSVVAMLLAQSAIDPDITRIYREILSPEGVEIFLRARQSYVGHGPCTFGDVMAAARARGEIAFGFLPPERPSAADPVIRRERLERGEPADDRGASLRLNPSRDEPVPDDDRVAIVVFARPT